ncbi:MAG: enoyl-CoA hydratase-related protein, partial [Myxococcota bacterium]
MYEHLLYAVEDPIATITFDRPDRLNAFTYRMLVEIRHALAAAEADERAVGIVLTGAGRGFSSGMDAESLQADADAGATGRTQVPPELRADAGDRAMGRDF